LAGSGLRRPRLAASKMLHCPCGPPVWVVAMDSKTLVNEHRMDPDKKNKKSREILKELARGRTCEQVVANDTTVTYHDVFHAVSEAPTSHWRKKAVKAGKITKSVTGK